MTLSCCCIDVCYCIDVVLVRRQPPTVACTLLCWGCLDLKGSGLQTCSHLLWCALTCMCVPALRKCCCCRPLCSTQAVLACGCGCSGGMLFRPGRHSSSAPAVCCCLCRAPDVLLYIPASTQATRLSRRKRAVLLLMRDADAVCCRRGCMV